MIFTKPFIIAESLNLMTHSFVGDNTVLIDSVISVNDIQAGDVYSNSICWINDKNAPKFHSNCEIGLMICTPTSYEKIKSIKANFIVTQSPRLFFQKILLHFFQKPFEKKIEPSAFIHPSAKVHESCYIGHFTIIEENVVVNENTYIGHHNVISANTIIGKNVHIGNHNSIGHAGYGYEKNEKGEWEPLPHLGNVIIGNNVSIHSFVAVDKGVLGSTTIGDNVKIDNHSQISHNVQIGKNTMVLQAASIGGSAVIEENCWLGHDIAIINKATIGKNTFLANKAVIIRSLPPNSRYTGHIASRLDF